jgi:hypothetical protein
MLRNEASEPVTAEPQMLALPDSVTPRPVAGMAGVEEVTNAAADLGALLDRVALVDALLLRSDPRSRPGVVDVAEVESPAAQAAGIVLSSHALAEAVARIDGAKPDLPADATTTASVGPEGPPAAGEPSATDRRLAAACDEFIDSLLEDLDGLAAGLAGSDDMYLVPIEGCVPSADNGEAVSAMRSLLAADRRVMGKLSSAGYQSSDLVGASIDGAGRLSVFVVQ